MIEKILNGISFFARFLNPSRLRTLSLKIKNRTDFITIVVDDIYQPHNASAVLRSCDAFGIVDVYVVEQKGRFEIVKGISNSAEKWLNIKRFKDYESCYKELRENNYKICVSSQFSRNSISLYDFKVREKLAIVIGSEMKGVSDFFKERADYFLTIPMKGFVESLNLSVAAGIILYELRKKLEESDIDYTLSPILKSRLFYNWVKKDIPYSDKLKV